MARKVGPTTYEVLHPEKVKKKQTYVNLLKAWMVRGASKETTSLLVHQVAEEDDSKGVVEAWKGPGEMDLSHLEGNRPVELHVVFDDFLQLFQQKPGWTSVLKQATWIKAD